MGIDLHFQAAQAESVNKSLHRVPSQRRVALRPDKNNNVDDIRTVEGPVSSPLWQGCGKVGGRMQTLPAMVKENRNILLAPRQPSNDGSSTQGSPRLFWP